MLPYPDSPWQARSDPIRQITILQAGRHPGVVGLLAAGLLLPYVGGLGLVAGKQADKFLDTTCNLTETPPPQKTTIYASDGKTAIATLFTQDREPIPLASVPKYLQEALIATEDRRFYSHHGVDMRGLIRSRGQHDRRRHPGRLDADHAVRQAGPLLPGDRRRQARRRRRSTRTLNRKMEDAKCALDIEKTDESKDKILDELPQHRVLRRELLRHPDRGADLLQQERQPARPSPESALLVGMLRAPSEYDPFNDRKAAQARRNQVIQNLVDVGNYISQAEGRQVQGRADRPRDHGAAAGSAGMRGAARRHPQRAVLLRLRGAAGWRTPRRHQSQAADDRRTEDRHYARPQACRTAAQDSLWTQVPAKSPTTAVMPVVDPQTGNVLAMATSKQYGNPTSPADDTHTVLPVFTDPVTGRRLDLQALPDARRAQGRRADVAASSRNNDVASNYTKYNTRTAAAVHHAQQQRGARTTRHRDAGVGHGEVVEHVLRRARGRAVQLRPAADRRTWP